MAKVFFPLLAVLFIGLKLGHIIDWSWWIVLIPVWGGMIAIAAVWVGTMFFLSSLSSGRRRK